LRTCSVAPPGVWRYAHMRPWLVLLCLLCLVMPGAQAHGIFATVTLDPAMPQAGRPAKLLVSLIDPYGVPYDEAQVRASVRRMDELPRPLTPLALGAPGEFTGQVQFPSEIVAGMLRVEVDFADDKWFVELPLRLDADWFTVKQVPVDLTQTSLVKVPTPLPVTPAPLPVTPTPIIQPSPPADSRLPVWWLLGGISSGLILYLVWLARKKR
jgi:hypothetical protein